MKITKIAAVSALLLCVLLAIASAGCTGNTTQNIVGDTTIVADSALSTPMNDIVKAFEKKYPKVNVSITYGTSSEIASQILANTIAPNDFVSTDADSINRVATANLTAGYIASTLPYNVMIDTASDEFGVLFTAFMGSADGKAIFKSHGYPSTA